MIDPLSRLELPDVEAMIDRQRYFVLHVPARPARPPVGWPCASSERPRPLHALYANIEAAQAMRGDVDRRLPRAALMQGEAVEDRLPSDDVQYVEDLGLIVTRPQLAIANRIYREIIPRELTWTLSAAYRRDR